MLNRLQVTRRIFSSPNFYTTLARRRLSPDIVNVYWAHVYNNLSWNQDSNLKTSSLGDRQRWPREKVSAPGPAGSRLETEVWTGVCQLRCHPRHLTAVQNDELRQKISLMLLQNETLV
ncbi:hypothetical protein AVEN_145079-1 [Araneus ventricosus]|uniref:Uncharacterized protein n=1 Tax=Araneus ventricosus TaxID=182803 RepID=A0A4Y2J140_ARAVE|nr:hypothetical protein AVEN_145079-1 [Araneus ventricosus]